MYESLFFLIGFVAANMLERYFRYQWGSVVGGINESPPQDCGPITILRIEDIKTRISQSV